MDPGLDKNIDEITKVREQLENDENSTVESITKQTESESKGFGSFTRIKEKTLAGLSATGRGLSGAGSLAISGGGALGRGAASVVRAPGVAADTITKITEMKFMPAFIFVVLGGIDFFVNYNFGHSQFSLIFDIGLAVFGLIAFQSYLAFIPAFFEIVYPRWIAINFGWPNTLPFWAIFGIIMFSYSLPKMDMSKGDSFILIMTVLAIGLFYVSPSDGGWGNIMARNVDAGPVEELSGFIAQRTEEGWFRVGGIFGDVTDCAVPDWMGGAKNCTALERRIDPTYADTMRSKNAENIDEMEFKLSISDMLDSEFYTDERIRLRANFNLESDEYPVKGAFSWKLGDSPGEVSPVLFETKISDKKHRVGDTSVYGTWKEGTFTEKGTYTAEVSAFFSVISEASYKTWFIKNNDELSLDYYYDNYKFLRDNRIPKSEAPAGPVDILVGLGQMEAPIIISENVNDFQPTLVIALNDENYGSKTKKLKSISYVVVKKEDWFRLDGENSCGEFELKGDLWYLKAESLAKYNRKLTDRAQSPEIYCEMQLNHNELFQQNILDPEEVTVRVQVSYEYEIKDSTSIRIENPYEANIYNYLYCVEGTEYKNDYDTNKAEWDTNYVEQIKKKALATKVPFLIAFSVAQEESSMRQYYKNGLTVKNDNKNTNQDVISSDFGLFQINDKAHGDSTDMKQIACSYEANINYGVSYLKSRYGVCARWEMALNAYNTGKCVWAKEGPDQGQDEYREFPSGKTAETATNIWSGDEESYSRRVEAECKALANIYSWSAEQCTSCIREDKNCYTAEENAIHNPPPVEVIA